ncbi:MAG TPA: acyl-CoA desaturase, partial [Steroidobacteraceae bacterium]|nr:acyl-CoA desaturase [Steroidobacteraceae bacterium]
SPMSEQSPSTLAGLMAQWKSAFTAWLDSSAVEVSELDANRVDWLRTIPFVGMHLACFGIIWVGVSTTAVIVAVAMYALRMLAITGFYHRYFSHRTFRTSRSMQFVFAALGAMAVQRGPLWWAAHHRHHHAHSDEPIDAHSPNQHGFFWSHIGWFMNRRNFATRTELVKDLAQYPELRFLDRFDVLMPVVLAVVLFTIGGAQLLVWGFFVSTVVLYHATFTVNSLAHVFGRRRYATRDFSRNNWLLALVTFGEGWHNNHHHFPGSIRQGFYWWEIDLTYYVLRTLAALGLIWDLKTVPARIRDARRDVDGAIRRTT